MSRLFDRLLRKGAPLLSAPPSTPVFEVTNIADFANSQGNKYLTLQDLPNIAPPFPEFFLEAGYELVMADLNGQPWIENGVRVSLKSRSVGMHVKAFMVGTGDGVVQQEAEEITGKSRPEDAYWMLGCRVYLDSSSRIVEVGAYNAWADRQGNPLENDCFMRHPDYDTSVAHARVVDNPFAARVGNTAAQIADVLGESIARSLFLAVSFLHCKNVERIEIAPDAKLSRSAQKKYDIPLVRYHVLQITPFNQRGGGGSGDGTGSPKSMHVVRGHFKTWTAERPLFGRVVGTFWVQDHVAGRSTTTVNKDYAVSLRGAL